MGNHWLLHLKGLTAAPKEGTLITDGRA